MTTILAIAGCFPSLYPRASRPLHAGEVVPREHEDFLLQELERPVYIHEVCASECVCYLPEEVVRDLIRIHRWQEVQ
jgi:hypothetical protein